MNSPESFEQQFNDCFAGIKQIDFLEKGTLLGIEQNRGTLILNFFNRKITLSGSGIHDIKGCPLTDAVKTVLCRYLLMCPDSICASSNRLITLREFPGSGPLFSNFATNTGKIIETTFSGRLQTLKDRCLSLGGTTMENPSYDLSVQFRALSRIPIILNFNDKDEMMGACAGLLFYDDADKYLDLKCLTILCTYLTGNLIQQDS